MKKSFFCKHFQGVLWATVASAGLLAFHPASALAGSQDLLPKPKELAMTDSGIFTLGGEVCLNDPTNCELLREVLTNYGCTITESSGKSVNVEIVSSIDGAFLHAVSGMPEEAYTLHVTSDEIRITALELTGVIRAAQTLNQLAEGTELEGNACVESVDIKDWPAFKVRGFMHDVGRSFIPFDELKHEIDLLSRFKVNVFHWHLTEKLAWRFEVVRYPELTASSNMIRYPGEYYTQEQCRELVDYAAKRGVMVIPEIDMPGHSDVFTTAMGFSMQTDQGVEALKNILDEVAEVFASAPYIHIGGDEVDITYPNFLQIMYDHLHAKGKKVVMWNRLKAGAPSASYCDMTQMWATSGKVVTGLPNIDCRYNYTNHFDVYADLVGIYKSNIYYTQKGTSDVAGTISAAWNDTKTNSWEDIVRQNNIYANILASTERAWCGGGEQYIETGGTTLPNTGAEFEAFQDFENRFLFHKAHSLQDEPIPYVRQCNVHWRISDPFPNNGDKTMQFPPELTDEGEDGVLPSTFTYNGQEYGSRLATGAGIYLRHIWHSTIPSWFSNPAYGQTAYAWTYVYSPVDQTAGAQVEFYTYSRSGNETAPPEGEWDRRGSKLWVNGEPVAAPAWDRPNASIPQDNATLGLTNENLTARPVVQIALKQGWNKVLMRLPHAAASGTGRDKWQFTFVLTDTEGKNALDGIVYSPSKVKGESALQLDLLLDEISAYLRSRYADKVGYFPLSACAGLTQKVEEINATLGQDMTETERNAQCDALSEAFEQLKSQEASIAINQPKTSTAADRHCYTLQTPLRESLYLKSQGAAANVTGTTTVTDAAKWEFSLRSDMTYDIVNAADGTFLSPAASNNKAVQTVETSPANGWTVSASNELGYVIVTSGSVQLNQTKGGEGAALYNWGGGSNLIDTGCKFVVNEVEAPAEEVTNIVIASTEELRNDKVYVIQSGCSTSTTDYYLLYHENAPDNLSSNYGSGYTSIPYSPTTPNYQFSICKFGDTFYFYNVAADKFIGTVSGDGLAIPMVDTPNTGVLIRASENETYNFVLSCNDGAGLLNAARKGGVNGICNWEAGKDNFTASANIFRIIEVGSLPLDLQVSIPQKIASSLLEPAMAIPSTYVGEGLGQYSYTGPVNVAETLAAAQELMNGTTAPAYEEVKACVDNLNAVTNGLGAINQPTPGKLYRFKCAANGKWLTAQTNAAGKVQMAEADNTGTIFLLNEDGHLLSYATGQFTGNMSASPYMKLFDVGTSTANLNAFTFKDVYALATADVSKLGRYGLFVGSRNLYGSKSDGLVNSGSSGGSITGDAGYQWYIEEVTHLPVPVHATYRMGTFYSPVPLQAEAEGEYAENELLKFFTGKLDDEGYLVMTLHRGNIPAQTPFVIELQEGADYDAEQGCVLMKVASAADGLQPETYSLTGCLATQPYSAPTEESDIVVYTLQEPSSAETEATTPLVFRKFNGSTLAGFRAYLEVPASMTVKGMRFDGTTGLEGVQAGQKATEAVYDLFGRKVNRMGKGLYVVNGKKIYIR